MRKPLSFFAAMVAAGLCLSSACGPKPTASNSEAATSSAGPVDYSPRIGVGVRTDHRTCIAIRNGTVTPNAPVTLIVPGPPQSFIEAQIAAQSGSACPITQDVPAGVVSYDVSLPDSASLAKLTPFAAVLGTAASNTVVTANNGVVADLDQTHSRNTFRACGADDGVHLTVWRNDPLTGKPLWSGYYYESGNPGTLPTCGAAELGR